MFKQGAFVNVLTSESARWKAMLAELENLPALDHVELWIEHIPRGSGLRELKDIFRGVPKIVHGPFIHTSLVSHIPEVIELTEKHFDDTVEFASSIDARVVTFHAGSYPIFVPREEAMESLASRFERFTQFIDPVATLENMPIKSHGTVKEPIGNLDDYEEILALLPNLNFTLDIGHCIQNKDDFESFLVKHRSRIVNIHLHDGCPGGKGHMCLGTGALDLDRFLDTLKTISFTGYVGMETISMADTTTSWKMLRDAEITKGILKTESTSSTAYSFGRRP